MRGTGRVLIIGLTTLAVAGISRAQSADPITQREIIRLTAAAVPHINAVLAEDNPARRPIAVPKIQFLSPAEFHRLPDLETDAIVRARLGVLSGQALEHALHSAHDACAAVALARYRPGTDTIAVSLPLDERRLASWSPSAFPDPPELAGNRILQLAIVHEAVRMHLDREYHWMERLSKCRDEDELRTLLALVEGRARQVVDRVADKLGSYPYAAVLAQRYRTVPDDGPDPDRLAVVRAMVFRIRQDGGNDGKNFFEQLARAQVKPVEATPFTTPPRQLLWISRPELYVKALRSGIPDLAQVLKQLENLPPAAKWTASQQPLGPDLVREVAAMLQEQTRAEAVLRGWEEGRTLLWTPPGAAGHVVVSATRFESPAAARAYHGFSLDLQRKRDEQMSSNCTGACRVVESRCEAVPVAGAEAAARCFKRIQYSGGRPPAEADMLYVLAGNLVVEVGAYSTPLDPTWARKAIEALLAAYAPPRAQQLAQ